MAAILHIIRNAPQQGIVGHIQRRHDQELVSGKVLGFGKDEIRTNIHVVERPIELMDQGGEIGLVVGLPPLLGLGERHVV